MGADNQPKARQLRRKETKETRRASYDRILIVTEGSKTEPMYLEEIRKSYHLHSTNVQVQPGRMGTEPIQVVDYARQLFENGDLSKGIRPKSFEKIYAVFDRDAHRTYFQALSLAQSLDNKLRNDCGQLASFKAIASIPNFELWLLLHDEDIRAPMDRYEVVAQLKKYIPNYNKGAGGFFNMTRDRLKEATERAEALATQFDAYSDPEPFTAMHELVTLLTTLNSP